MTCWRKCDPRRREGNWISFATGDISANSEDKVEGRCGVSLTSGANFSDDTHLNAPCFLLHALHWLLPTASCGHRWRNSRLRRGLRLPKLCWDPCDAQASWNTLGFGWLSAKGDQESSMMPKLIARTMSHLMTSFNSAKLHTCTSCPCLSLQGHLHSSN